MIISTFSLCECTNSGFFPLTFVQPERPLPRRQAGYIYLARKNGACEGFTSGFGLPWSEKSMNKKVGKNEERSCGLKNLFKSTKSIQTRKAVAWVYVKMQVHPECGPCQRLVAMIWMFNVSTSRGRHTVTPVHPLSTWPVFLPLPLLFFLGFCRGKTK